MQSSLGWQSPIQAGSDLTHLTWPKLIVKKHPSTGLHYGNYRSKLVPFEEQKNIFYILKMS